AQVRITLTIPRHPLRLPAFDRNHAQPDHRVLLARPRITERVRLGFGMSGIENVHLLYFRQIALLVGDLLAIGRPPEAGEAVHLLLRDEFSLAMAQGLGGAGGEAVLASRIDVDDVEIAIAHARDLMAIGRKLRIDGKSRGALELDTISRGPVEQEEPASQ